MAISNPQTDKILRIPFLDAADLRPGQETLLSKDQVIVNGYFEPAPSPTLNLTFYHFIKRPGLSTFQTVTPTGPGRGCYAWKQTGQIYSVNNNKILANNTDLGVTLTTTASIVNFEETRPGATTQYLGVNDGITLVLIATDNSVIVLNNVPITSSSVANPTVITTGSNHNLNTGNKIIIRNHTGSTPSINDTIFTITRLSATTFSIPVNVTVGGTGGTIGVFPAPNTNDLHYMDGYWFTMKVDGSVWNCAVDDPTTWPVANTISAIMWPGRGVGLSKQANTLVAFTDRHMQLFYDAANPVGSPLANIDQAVHRIGCAATDTIAFQEDTTFWVSSTLTGGFTVYQLTGTTQLQDIGTPTLERSLVNNFFNIPGTPNPTRVVLTSGTSWTVPGDFNKNNNTIEAIGGGAGGAGSQFHIAGGAGGGGGAYAKLINFDPLGAGSIPIVIGQGGAGSLGTSAGNAGTDTTFNATSLVAKAGGSDGTFNDGGSAASSTGNVTANGGNGGLGTFSQTAPGGGGGGAGGKLGDGNPGSAGVGTSGGTGGQGDFPLGGAGGIADSNGSNGTEWASAGSGGGGGGGSFNAGTVGNVGGTGGLYGAGGGGAGNGGVVGFGTGGNGANGVIVITYTPAAAQTSSSGNGYILRVAGHMFYILNLAINNETWVYDVKFKLWSKWVSGTSYWPIINTTQLTPVGQPSVLVGQDPSTGTIWKIDPLLGQDNGVNYLVRLQTSPFTHGSMVRKFYNRVELVGDKQTSSTPVLVSYSDNDYASFGPTRTLDMGNTRAFSRSWGNSRRRAWRLDYTGPNPLRISELELSYSEETGL